MSSTYGENLRVTIFGQSHSAAIGVTIEGLPAGERLDFDALLHFLERRAPGRSNLATARHEADRPEFLSGLKGDTLCGPPLTAIIPNGDTRSKDYSQLEFTPRPGHADYTASIKYHGAQDFAGGGHFSGRLTAPLCIAGGICLQLLQRQGIQVISRIAEIAGIHDKGELVQSTADKSFPTVSEEAGAQMCQAILEAKSQGDSIGGVVECAVLGLPAGLGDPIFDGMENRIARIVFGIPAVKGLEFGDGFASSRLRGSENNDPFEVCSGQIRTTTNHAGGILGGITTGMPLVFRAAIKPTPSISMPQDSVDMRSMEIKKLVIQGRHDPCIVPRAVPVVEAAAAIAVYDAFLQRKKEL